MATRNFVPRRDGEGSVGKSRKHWRAAYIDTLFVKAIEVLGGGTENDAQPATVGWVREYLKKGIEGALAAIGVTYSIGDEASYVSFGKAFGKLLIQWGRLSSDGATGKNITLPVAYNYYMDYFFAARILDSSEDFKVVTHNQSGSQIKIAINTSNARQFNIGWLAVGAVR
jgi:hypothetical protein